MLPIVSFLRDSKCSLAYSMAQRSTAVEKVFNFVELSNFQIYLLTESLFFHKTYLYPLMPIFHFGGATSLASSHHAYILVCFPGRKCSHVPSLWSPTATQTMQAVHLSHLCHPNSILTLPSGSSLPYYLPQ